MHRSHHAINMPLDQLLKKTGDCDVCTAAQGNTEFIYKSHKNRMAFFSPSCIHNSVEHITSSRDQRHPLTGASSPPADSRSLIY